MFLYMYHFLWTLGMVLCIPLVPLIKKRRVADRLALGLTPFSSREGAVWVHALSVGEVISALPLVRRMQERFPERDVFFSVTTSKGMEIARKELGSGFGNLLTMPVDFWWCVRRAVRHVNPSLFILVETDIWPGLIRYLGKRGIRSVLVNGRISPGTFRSYMRFPRFTRFMFHGLDACLMQSDLDRDRLLRVGLDPASVVTVGNIKFDRDWEPMEEGEGERLRRDLALEPLNMLWVCGSTHSGEEKILLRVFEGVRPHFPDLRMVIAPRNVERAGEVLALARDMGFNAALKTGLAGEMLPYDVLILDTMGELGRIYGQAQISFVGGSLVPLGGHNLLEPAGFGCPVLFGPHTHNFVLMADMLSHEGGGLRVHDGKELQAAVEKLLSQEATRSMMGERARAFVEKNRGALERVVSCVTNGMDSNGPGV
jgi:3-deoxy-D-manno-octulosonic-acid transferase